MLEIEQVRSCSGYVTSSDNGRPLAAAPSAAVGFEMRLPASLLPLAIDADELRRRAHLSGSSECELVGVLFNATKC